MKSNSYKINNRKKTSIKWIVFRYLFIFIAILLILLWLFQIVFLEEIYTGIKIGSIKSYAKIIEKNIDSDELQTLINRISHENEVSIRIIDNNMENLYISDIIPDSMIHRMDINEIRKIYSDIKASNKSFLNIHSKEKFRDHMNNDRGLVPKQPPMNKAMVKIMIYADVIELQDGSEALVMLSSVITPVNTTVETLRVEFIFIAVILLILTLIIALFLCSKISYPIIKINESAKKLAEGEYDIKFTGDGYLEINELNDTLNYTARELSKVETLRRELIANVSHDLRTPLTMIIGYGEVMRDLPGENTPENVQIVIDEAKRLTNLVNDMLDISKIQSGSQELVLSRISLTEVIRELINTYNKLMEQDKYNIDFQYDQGVYVYADKVKISQVAYNLINNAINYTGEDRRVTVIQTVNNGIVKIEVVDTGNGIREEDIKFIWDRYYKVDKTHKRAAIGTGLGLSIVKTILDMHGCQYGVESTEGVGSNFWFEIKEDK